MANRDGAVLYADIGKALHGRLAALAEKNKVSISEIARQMTRAWMPWAEAQAKGELFKIFADDGPAVPQEQTS